MTVTTFSCLNTSNSSFFFFKFTVLSERRNLLVLLWCVFILRPFYDFEQKNCFDHHNHKIFVLLKHVTFLLILKEWFYEFFKYFLNDSEKLTKCYNKTPTFSAYRFLTKANFRFIVTWKSITIVIYNIYIIITTIIITIVIL